MRALLVRALVPAYLLLIGGLPLVGVSLLLKTAPAGFWMTLALLASPAVGCILLALTTRLLSLPVRWAVMPGRFQRDLRHEVYGPRRLHSLCWTAIYYCPPVYHAVLATPLLKRLTLRLFGYPGALSATLYPDTWVRDLPLLDLGDGAYIANRATLGSNVCLASGDIIVDRITIGAGAVVGHLAVIGLGGRIAAGAEIGVGTTLGMNVTVGAGTVVDAIAGLNHGATIGTDCRIDSGVYVGKKAVVGDRLHLYYGSLVPDRAVITTQRRPIAVGLPARRRRRSVASSQLRPPSTEI